MIRTKQKYRCGKSVEKEKRNNKFGVSLIEQTCFSHLKTEPKKIQSISPSSKVKKQSLKKKNEVDKNKSWFWSSENFNRNRDHNGWCKENAKANRFGMLGLKNSKKRLELKTKYEKMGQQSKEEQESIHFLFNSKPLVSQERCEYEKTSLSKKRRVKRTSVSTMSVNNVKLDDLDEEKPLMTITSVKIETKNNIPFGKQNYSFNEDNSQPSYIQLRKSYHFKFEEKQNSQHRVCKRPQTCHYAFSSAFKVANANQLWI